MANGIALTDADRWDWLVLLRQKAVQELEHGTSGVVVTCSALKRKYRDVIRIASYNDHNVLVHFIYLKAPKEVLLARVLARKGHFMGANMVESQFASLEEPTADETDVVTVDVTAGMPEVQASALKQIKQVAQIQAVASEEQQIGASSETLIS